MTGYDYTGAGAYFVTICTNDIDHDCRGDACVAPTTNDAPYPFGHIDDGRMVLNGAGSIALDCLCAIPGHFPTVELDAFIVMPNHVHFLVIDHDDRDHDVGATHASPLRTMTVCGPRAGSLGAIVGSFKSAVTRRVNELRGSPGARLWQRNYYERIVRDEAELRRIRGYIASNPAKWDTDENNPRGGRMRRLRACVALKESWR
jgi:REP element-mobilizing transposase RayT